jgi:hypothetical protein
VGPDYHICHADEQISLLVHTPLDTPLENPKDTFSVTLYGVTVDAIKASSESSD